MPLPFWILLVGVMLPYLWGGVGVAFRKKQFGTLDNSAPRDQQAKATGAGARALGAERNAWEALAVFTPGVIAAHLFAPASTLAPTLALVWLVARVGHGGAYLANVPPLRSAMFFVGFLCAVGMFLIAGRVL